MAAIEDVEVGRIRTDGGTQPRAEIIPSLIDDYREAMDEGEAVFPPVTVFYDGTNYWLADGFHRLAAHKRLELDTVRCDLRQGTLADAVWYSCGANATHGQRRSNKDKRRAVETALRNKNVNGLSNRQIAKHCGVSHTYVGKVKREMGWNDDKPRPEVAIPDVQPDQRDALEAALTLPPGRRRSDDEIAETFGVSEDAIRNAREELDAWAGVEGGSGSGGSGGGRGSGDPAEVRISAGPERDAAPKRVIKLPRDPMQAGNVLLKNFAPDDLRTLIDVLEQGLAEMA